MNSVHGHQSFAVLVVMAAVEPAEAMLPTMPVSKLLACELPVVSANRRTLAPRVPRA